VERRFAVHARAYRKALIAALALASGTVSAAPKGGEARVQFNKGVAAYTKGDYQAASEALGASFVLEADAETLFAWAQTERKLGHCDRAIELYSKLLGMDLPDENKQAVRVQINECKAIVAEQKPTPEPAPAPAPAPAASLESHPPPLPPEPTYTWWKDPVGDAIVGAGAVALVAGIVFMAQGSSADSDKAHAMTYPEYASLADRAESRGRLGLIGIAVGGGLIAGGITWYVQQKGRIEHKATALLVPGGGGVAFSGRF
jgi:tetratricopeptide (TPR) repeat protein